MKTRAFSTERLAATARLVRQRPPSPFGLRLVRVRRFTNMRFFLTWILLAFSAFLPPTAAAQAADERPNVVLIMADDVGYECFGPYGSK